MATPRSKAGTKGVPRQHRQQQILAAATEEFGTRGYAAASLASIADRVGVTKTLLHQYFGTKEDLYLACLTPVGDRLLDTIRTAMGPDGTSPHTPLRSWAASSPRSKAAARRGSSCTTPHSRRAVRPPGGPPPTGRPSTGSPPAARRTCCAPPGPRTPWTPTC